MPETFPPMVESAIERLARYHGDTVEDLKYAQCILRQISPRGLEGLAMDEYARRAAEYWKESHCDHKCTL